jgi:tetratricopeptide (TPR) repeat protein
MTSTSTFQRVQECRQAFMESGDRWSAMIALQQLGAMADKRGELDESLQYHQEGAVLAEEINDRPGLSYMLTHLGRLQRKKNNFQRAVQYHLDYLRLWLTMGNQQALKKALFCWRWIGFSWPEARPARPRKRPTGGPCGWQRWPKNSALCRTA